MAHDRGLVTKSNLILGMGETEDEIEQALADLRGAGCDILTITQYLRPSTLHHPIERWVKPEEFVHWSRVGEDLGFAGVMSGPLVRSSYRAGRLWAQAVQRSGRPVPQRLREVADREYTPARQEAAHLLDRRPTATAP